MFAIGQREGPSDKDGVVVERHGYIMTLRTTRMAVLDIPTIPASCANTRGSLIGVSRGGVADRLIVGLALGPRWRPLRQQTSFSIAGNDTATSDSSAKSVSVCKRYCCPAAPTSST